MKFGSLFAGIGGFDLGLERAGMTCEWQVEQDSYASRVLGKRWPKAEPWDDVRTFPPKWGNWHVDLICGGFPCQDISNAGKRAGISGERSGLWSEFARIIGVLRPRYVLVENVQALLGRGMDRVLGDLSELGYDAEWQVISAADIGAHHIRKRVWILAYPQSGRCPEGKSSVADTDSERLKKRSECHGESKAGIETPLWSNPGGRSPNKLHAPDAQGLGSKLRPTEAERPGRPSGGSDHDVQHPLVFPSGPSGREQLQGFAEEARHLYQWGAEPPVCGVAHGVPARTHRLRCLGNAVVPQIAEYIGRHIMALENA